MKEDSSAVQAQVTDPRAYAAFYDASIAHLQRLAHASLRT